MFKFVVTKVNGVVFYERINVLSGEKELIFKVGKPYGDYENCKVETIVIDDKLPTHSNNKEYMIGFKGIPTPALFHTMSRLNGVCDFIKCVVVKDDMTYVTFEIDEHTYPYTPRYAMYELNELLKGGSYDCAYVRFWLQVAGIDTNDMRFI